jgi:hypothetical protein
MRVLRPTLLLAALIASALSPRTSVAERPSINHRTGLYEAPLSDLRKASERGDLAELARAGERIGPARMAKALADRDGRIVRAALEAIPLLRSGVLLIAQVAHSARAADRSIREQGLRALSRLLGTTNGEQLAAWEVPAESLRAACQALIAAASNEAEQSSLRLLALQGLADAGLLCAVSFHPSQLLKSNDPQVRRAAVLALPASPQTKAEIAIALKDRDGRVAAAAGARLCALAGGAVAASTEPSLGKVALAEGAVIEDVVDLLPCLARSKVAEDERALETLRSRGPAVVRNAIKSLTGAEPDQK